MTPLVQSTDIRLPTRARLVNLVGRGLTAAKIDWPPLQEGRLLEQAVAKTGLNDFGDDGFREGLRRLLSALREEAQLTLVGKLAAYVGVSRLLNTRLEIVDFIKRHPDVHRQRIVAPIFIVGLPRSGTTILQHLLSCDSATRSPLSWEVARPCAPAAGPDTRIETTRHEMARLHQRFPGLQAMHPIGPELPEECIQIMAYDFCSAYFGMLYDIPTYNRWCRETDLTSTFQFHKQFLQLLNHGRPGERWLLKSPSHISALEFIFAVYPDARVVHLHRDPAQVLPSLASLTFSIRRLTSDRADRAFMGAPQVAIFARTLDKLIETRQSLAARGARIHDLQFVDLMHDPIGAIKGIYARFDLEFAPVTEQAMRTFLAANGRDKHGKHHYAAAMYGMREADLAAAFRAYCEHFDVRGSASAAKTTLFASEVEKSPGRTFSTTC